MIEDDRDRQDKKMATSITADFCGGHYMVAFDEDNIFTTFYGVRGHRNTWLSLI
jgi:hypothetical protein